MTTLIIIEKIYLDKISAPPIRKGLFTKLLGIATQGMFLYKNKSYQLLEEVAMGSPLGPTLATSSFWLQYSTNKTFGPKLRLFTKTLCKIYGRYFCHFEKKKTYCSKLVNVLNHQHKNMKFPMEKSTGAFPSWKIFNSGITQFFPLCRLIFTMLMKLVDFKTWNRASDKGSALPASLRV